MRKIIHAIFVISALVALVLCSACVLPSFGEPKKQEGGLTQVNVPIVTSRISFDEAYQNLKDYQIDSINTSSIASEKIYYILGKDVDESGNAMSWVFGVNYGAGNKVLIYEKSGWTVFARSNTILPPEEIVVDHVISPGTLLTRNSEKILTLSSAIPEMRDLELQQGNYILTLYTGNTTKILTFNATTGVVIA
jgi:hypothetical protein